MLQQRFLNILCYAGNSIFSFSSSYNPLLQFLSALNDVECKKGWKSNYLISP